MGGSARAGGGRSARDPREGGDGEGPADDDRVLVHVLNAGQDGVNGTYRRHRGDPAGRYTSMGRYKGEDAEYSIELRVAADGGSGVWYLSCRAGNPGEPPVDFYRARVGECAYPYRVRWEAATLLGTFPAPRVEVSHFT